MGHKISIIPPGIRALLEASVENVEGTGGDRCSRCGSWIKHWENLSGKRADKCASVGCPNNATDGAHVYILPDRDSIYIIPLCHECNTSKVGAFDTKDGIEPVPVEHPED